MKEASAYIHTHWDREWYRTFEAFRLRLIDVFDKVLKALENGSIPCFYFDGQTAALEDYLELRPEKLETVKRFIKEKKLYAGPFYCSSDSLLASAESLYRNLKYGIEKSKEWEIEDFIAYIPDSFGHSADLPVLLKHFGLDKAVLWRGLGNLTADLDWNGIKTVNLVQGYFQNFLHSYEPIEIKAENLKKYLDKISGKSGNAVLLPIGGDHLAAVKNIKDIVKKLNEIYKDYKINLETPFEYFKKIKKWEKTEGEFLDNSRTFLLKGVYSARPDIKRANAYNQWLLFRKAEPFNALASKFFGAENRQSALNYACKELIKNHAHDSIYGCVIDEVSTDVMQRFRKVNEIAAGVIKSTIRDIEEENGVLTAVNLSNYKYSGKIFIETEKELPDYLNAVKISSRKGFTDKKLYDINDVPVTEDITDIKTYLIDVCALEPFSLTKITPDKVCPQSSIKTGSSFIENEYIKIEVLKGALNVLDKKTKTEYKNFISVIDRADIGDSYNFGALKNDRAVKAELKTFKIKTEGAVRAVLKTVYEINIPVNSDSAGRSKRTAKCRLNLDFTLYNQSKTAEIKAEWINKIRNHLLQIGFNLKDKITETISEDLYRTVKRSFDTDYDIYKHLPAEKGIELKTNTAPMQRFVSAQNLTLITKGINEYEVNKNTLYLTLLRAQGIISNPVNPSRGTPAGPPLKTPDMQRIGFNCQEFAFLFTDKEEEMFEAAEEFYNPCISFFSNLENTVFFKPEGRVYAVYEENGCVMSRIYKDGLKNTPAAPQSMPG